MLVTNQGSSFVGYQSITRLEGQAMEFAEFGTYFIVAQKEGGMQS
jgi:hypothetical protein